MADEITRISASRLSQAIKSRDISCVEVIQAYLERIHQYNPLYNAIVSLVDDSELLRQAEAADKALFKGEYWGWMHDMPHAIKDLADAQGLVSTYGSPIFAQNVATADSLPVARIRAQGAIFIGKTNTRVRCGFTDLQCGVWRDPKRLQRPSHSRRQRQRCRSRSSGGAVTHCRRQRHDGFVAQSGRLQQCYWLSAKSGQSTF